MLKFLKDIAAIAASVVTVLAFVLTFASTRPNTSNPDQNQSSDRVSNPDASPGVPVAEASASPEAPAETQSWNPLEVLQQPSEEFSDIGIRFKANEGSHYPKVREISAGSPAEQAGLQVGDVILSIDDEPTVALNNKDIVERLKANQVRLRVAREGNGSQEITVAR
ncbi:S41 family peptidase [Leptolyngbya sp. FACHB-261]|uniref:S41 family peptidase n=1 Tax=Leptolyngbya sp. FACHB-261 TaxID=2692806 RepID=UPI0016835C00|nr:PDZ domain-containing protein [Leptolyngbya sp. FACHB-261]MBD2100598.1 PDZ domain-containing protein [Leptolyngbya sp. FACHB-261]